MNGTDVTPCPGCARNWIAPGIERCSPCRRTAPLEHEETSGAQVDRAGSVAGSAPSGPTGRLRAARLPNVHNGVIRTPEREVAP